MLGFRLGLALVAAALFATMGVRSDGDPLFQTAAFVVAGLQLFVAARCVVRIVRERE